MEGDGGVRAAEEAGGRARQDGRDGGTWKKAAVARSHLSWVAHLSDKKSDSPFRTPGSTAHFFSSMWLSLHSSGEGGRPCSCSARQAGDWFYWTSPFLKAFFFFIPTTDITMPSYTASDPTARRNYFPTSLRLQWCVRGLQAKLMGWCRNLQDIALIVHNSVSSLFECFSPRKTAHNCSSKKQIIVSFLSKLIFIVSVTQTHQPDLFPGDLSFREFCSVKFGSSHCSRSGRLNISIWLIDL